jgi:hypothetical protein
MRIGFILGAWLIAASPLFPQTHLSVSELLRFTLEESGQQLTRVLGQPLQVADAGPAHFTWYYQTDVLDKHDHSHLLMFRRSDGKLISVTRNFHLPTSVDALFPDAGSRTYYWPDREKPTWQVRVRPLSGDRLLIAMGVEKKGDPTTQIVVIRRSVLPAFLPWLASEIAPPASSGPPASTTAPSSTPLSLRQSKARRSNVQE